MDKCVINVVNIFEKSDKQLTLWQCQPFCFFLFCLSVEYQRLSNQFTVASETSEIRNMPFCNSAGMKISNKSDLHVPVQDHTQTTLRSNFTCISLNNDRNAKSEKVLLIWFKREYKSCLLTTSKYFCDDVLFGDYSPGLIVWALLKKKHCVEYTTFPF